MAWGTSSFKTRTTFMLWCVTLSIPQRVGTNVSQSNYNYDANTGDIKVCLLGIYDLDQWAQLTCF